VADITTATTIEKMIVTSLEVGESAQVPDTFSYALTLVQYTEPPPDPAPDDMADDIADEAGLLAKVMDIPNLLSAPDFGDPTPPLKGALDQFKGAMDGLGSLGPKATELFGA